MHNTMRHDLMGLVCGFGLLLGACAPTSTVFSVATLETQSSQEFIAGFASKLEALDVRLQANGAVQHYAGDDPRAFDAIVDRFYQTNPGYCPLERGFIAGDTGKRFLTLAGKVNANGSLEIRAFAYDLSAKPQVTFAFYLGSTHTAHRVRPCRTVGMP